MTDIIDNFLDKKYFNELHEVITSANFSWYYNKDVTTEGENKNNLYFYLNHVLYINEQPNSDLLELFQPLLNKMKYKKLIRVKVNLYPRTEKLRINAPHVDYPYKHKGFLFYFNTCDSKTFLQDTQIDCIANRGVYFDPTIPHSSSSCTNVQARFSLNVNYF